tara:strand:+ start:112 stop:903 length:792 start_codon:yes stop_codon:yes gene_type:complete
MTSRINRIFKESNKKLVTFTTAGDPDIQTSIKIIEKILKNKCDIIEIGMPFSDPMADGPTIQLSSNRAIKNGVTLNEIFYICKKIRKINNTTPIILMGYYNVIYNYGIKKFVNSCKKNEIDGLIIVDLQPEEDSDLVNELKKNNIDLIRLITPTTDKKRLKIILKNATGFLYYVTITGITGQKTADINGLKKSIKEIKKYTSLPIVAGFGIKNKKHVKQICKVVDGAVVGSSIVKIVEDNLGNKKKMLNKIELFTKNLKSGTN